MNPAVKIAIIFSTKKPLPVSAEEALCMGGFFFKWL